LRFGNIRQRLARFYGYDNGFTSIADPFIVYAPASPAVSDIGLSNFRIHRNNIPKADILRALQAFYIAYVVNNKPGITSGNIRMNNQTPNAGIEDTDTLPDYPSVTVLSATQALAAKGFTTILL
jgi:hypothetical protein